MNRTALILVSTLIALVPFHFSSADALSVSGSGSESGGDSPGVVGAPIPLPETQVVAKLHSVAQSEILSSQVLLRRSSSHEVRSFASVMVRDHLNGDRKLLSLVT